MDYGLLKGTLTAMRRFYRWMSLAVFAILATAGTAYFLYILRKYSGDRQDAIIAWLLLIAINCYNLYTMYYDALLTGKGYVTRTQQINMLGQMVYIVMAIGFIYAGFGLTAIVASQLVSTIIRRVASAKRNPAGRQNDLTGNLAERHQNRLDAIRRIHGQQIRYPHRIGFPDLGASGLLWYHLTGNGYLSPLRDHLLSVFHAEVGAMPCREQHLGSEAVLPLVHRQSGSGVHRGRRFMDIVGQLGIGSHRQSDLFCTDYDVVGDARHQHVRA